VATRLNAILLIPVVVALVFGGFRVQNSVQTWQRAQDAERTAELVSAALDYSHDLINERDVSVVPLLAGHQNDPTVKAARARTDRAAQAFDAAVTRMPHTASLERRVKAVRAGEKELPALRAKGFTRAMPGVQTEEGYIGIQHPLMGLANELGYGSEQTASYGRMLYSLELAKAAESLYRSIGTHIMVEDRSELAPGELTQQETAMASYAYLENVAVEEYDNSGTPSDVQRLKKAMSAAKAKGKQQVVDATRRAEESGKAYVPPPSPTEQVKLIAGGATPKQMAAKGLTEPVWFSTATLSFDAYRSVELHYTATTVDYLRDLSASAKRSAIVNSLIVLLALIAAFVVAGLMARSMSRGMRQLRNAALDVAGQRLPSLVEQLSRTEPGRVDTRVEAIPIATGDEIGEVARAFDQIHREAVRLASEQAMLRGNVNAIFTNLSRRNQGLIQRQLTLITDLENNEAEPEQLENLFKLDHLATRMRRNGENLLVLAGEEPGRQWNQPIPLVDVLRAAASEVEAYERIELVGIPETEIHGSAVTDLVHLLAELLENATSFSSPQTKVRVTATRLPDGRVMVEIHDRGIGLTAEDFADINHKLAEPPTVDAEVSKRMGLFVVGRLAGRHGIRVQLRPSGEQAGTTSLVMLPEPITHGGGGDEAPADPDFTVSRIVPEHHTAEFQAYAPTAAELGFDDSRYERPALDGGAPAPARSLDAINRSLRREERRAQLEAATSAAPPAAEAPAAEPQAFPEQTFPEQALPEQTFPGRPYAEQPLPEQPYAERHFPEQAFSEPAYGEQAFGDAQPYADPYAAPQPYDGPAAEPYAAPAGDGWGGWEQSYEASSFGGSYGQQAPAGYEASTYGGAVYPGQAGTADQAVPAGGQQAVPGADSGPTGPQEAAESVGFDRPEPTSGSSARTEAGLPRRDRGENPDAPPAEPVAGQPVPERPVPEHGGGRREEPKEWQSANDDHWRRAEAARDPRAGGVTPSGLPKRVPRANLVPGTAQDTTRSGPSVSRAPEDVRGRLSNLRRGVQQGRSAGTDTNGQGFGPDTRSDS
jgi:signal transduction histidine kinase